MIKNIIFDWSGVINDDLELNYNVVMNTFKINGGKPISLAEFKKVWEQLYMLFYNRYLPRLTKEKQDADYREHYTRFTVKYPQKLYLNIGNSLKKFKESGIRMAILSANPRKFILAEIRQFGLDGIFDDIESSVHDKTKVVADVIKKNGFDPRKTAIVGDTTHEIETGKHVNIKTIAVTWGYQNEYRIRKANPDFIVHNLAELEKAVLG